MTLRKVLITSGVGFIDSNLSNESIPDNQVIIIHNLSAGRLETIDNIVTNENVKIIQGNIPNREFNKHNFQSVDTNLVAVPNVVRRINDPRSTKEVNILGTLNILIEIRNNKINKVVFTSSDATYGNLSISPFNKSKIPSLHSLYALTKFTAGHYRRLNIFNYLMY
jgi:UDP-glucose 4-epimerase